MCSHLFYYQLQQIIHVRASGTLVTLKETEGTGSTLRTGETRWTFTATWQLTEVRSAPKKSEIVSNYSSFKLLFRFWLNYIPQLILYKQLPLSNLKTSNVNCTDIVWERDSRRRSSSFFFFLTKLRIPLFGQDRIGYGFQGNTNLPIHVLNRVSFLTGSEGWWCAVYMPRYQQYIFEKNLISWC